MSQLLDLLAGAERLAECKRQEREAVERHAQREKDRAKEAVRRLLRPRQLPGLRSYLPYWIELNHAEACIRDALRAYRFARGNSPIQTFGNAHARRCRELGVQQ